MACVGAVMTETGDLGPGGQGGDLLVCGEYHSPACVSRPSMATASGDEGGEGAAPTRSLRREVVTADVLARARLRVESDHHLLGTQGGDGWQLEPHQVSGVVEVSLYDG